MSARDDDDDDEEEDEQEEEEEVGPPAEPTFSPCPPPHPSFAARLVHARAVMPRRASASST